MRTPQDKPESQTGDEHASRIQDLLRAERVPPPAPPGLEAKLWARLENAPAMPSTAGASGGLTGSLWGWGLLGLAVVGLVAALTGVFNADPGSRSVTSEADVDARPGGEADPTKDARPESEADPAKAARPRGEADPEQAARPVGEAKGHQTFQVSEPAQGQGPSAGPEPLADEEARPVVSAPDITTKEEPALPKDGSATAPSQPPRRDPLAERTLISKATTALRASEPAAALTALAEHHRRFPRGELSEEREGLRVHALLAAGRHDDARKARARFLARFPQSIHAVGLESLDL